MRFAVYLLVCLLLGASALGATPAVVVVLNGEIDEFTKTALIEHFNEARKLGAKTVILEIDTYGGLVTSALEISHFLKRQDDLQVIAYVDHKAISAGAMIALACNQIVMEPSALLGDCAPISLTSGGELQSLGATERAKFESPILEDFSDSAHRNGYDPTLVTAMVSVGRVVHWIENEQGERRFVDEPTYQELITKGWKPVAEVRDPVDSAETLLTVGADLALKLGLAKAIEPSVQSLATSRDLTIVAELSRSTGEELIAFLGSAAVRTVLTTVFMLALYIVLSHPGHGMAEVVAVAALGVLVGVPLLTGYAQWWEILAILLGLMLIALEVFVIPGFGFTGISGILLLVGGLILTFVGKEPSGMPGFLPHLEGTWQALRQGFFVVLSGMVCSLLLGLWLQRHIQRLPYLGRLILTTTAPTPLVPSINTTSESWPVVGARGRAVTELRPGGSAAFYDSALGDSRIAGVISENGYVTAGTEVIVREVQGNRVVVHAVQV